MDVAVAARFRAWGNGPRSPAALLAGWRFDHNFVIDFRRIALRWAREIKYAFVALRLGAAPWFGGRRRLRLFHFAELQVWVTSHPEPASHFFDVLGAETPGA